MSDRKDPIIFLVNIKRKAKYIEIADRLQMPLAELVRRCVEAGLPIVRDAKYPGLTDTDSNRKSA